MKPLIVIAIACGVLMFLLHDWKKQKDDDSDDNFGGWI